MADLRVPISKRKPLIINVNKATYFQLVSLPGMSDAIAGKIMVHRKNHGDFKSLADLLTVLDRTELWLEQIGHRLAV